MARIRQPWSRSSQRKNGRKRPFPHKRAALDNLDENRPSLQAPDNAGNPTSFERIKRRSKILDFADYRRNHPTPAEAHLQIILNELNGGALQGRFERERVISGSWIVDFFFPEVRLAIEVDGPIHFTKEQKQKDNMKDLDCKRFDITVLRISNNDVFGDRCKLIDKLRSGWKAAISRNNVIIGLKYEQYFRI